MLGGLVANSLTKPHQSPVFDDPKDFGLEYEDVTFQAADGVKLSGWLIKGSTDKVIVQSHFGVMCCRCGFTTEGKGLIKAYDQDIHFLNQAKYLQAAGYSVLMYDFRGHGDSDVGKIPWVTWGAEETKDVIAAVDFVTNHPELSGANIGLLSICMGQGATTNAFGVDNGLRKYQNIKAMISVQPLDFPTFLPFMGLPKFLQRWTINAINKRTGIDFNKNTFRPSVGSINVPTLVIQNRNDAFLDESLVNEYYENLQVEKELHWIEIPKKSSNNFNRLAAYEWIGKNPDKVLEWFGKYV